MIYAFEKRKEKKVMRRQTKQTMIRGLSLFLAGIIGLTLQTNDKGLSAYFLLTFGIWEIGDVIADYFFNDEEEDTDKERPWKEVMKKFKVDVARMIILMLLSMMVELVMNDTGFSVHTLVAYLLVLFIYLLFIGIFTFFELKRTVMPSQFIEAKKMNFTSKNFLILKGSSRKNRVNKDIVAPIIKLPQKPFGNSRVFVLPRRF